MADRTGSPSQRRHQRFVSAVSFHAAQNLASGGLATHFRARGLRPTRWEANTFDWPNGQSNNVCNS